MQRSCQLTKKIKDVIIFLLCRSVGTGIQVGLKNRWGQLHEGSTPSFGIYSQFMGIRCFKWTSNLAYAVGLITTDGNLSSDKRHISITSSDKQLLYTFRKCLNLKNKITKNPKGGYTKRQCYRIQFGNVCFYNWLISIGLMPRKTFRIKAIKIPHKFLADFLRGHLDGDGSIATYEDKYNTFKNPKYIYKRLYVNFLSASQKHIKWISYKLKKIINIRGDISTYKKDKTNMHKLRFAKKESLKLLQWLYYKPNLYCLKRKRKIAESFLRKI